MRDEWRQAGVLQFLLLTGRLDRRTLLRTVGAVGMAGPLGAASWRPSAAAQDAGGTIFRSPSRARVMEEILAAYPTLGQGGAPEGGSVIFGGLGDLDSVNPLVASSQVAVEFLSLIYEGLVSYHPVNGSIIPWLADYEIAADGVTYTFHIHPDARFHDGAPVTAADAEFTFDMFFDPAGLAYFATAQEVTKEYRAVDERTFVMVSKGWVASFLYDVPTVVMPKHIWENVASADRPSDPGSTGVDPARVIGSGPFRFGERVEGDHATLVRNDDYWNQELSRTPYLENLFFKILSDNQARALALEVGDVDVARLAPEDSSRLASASGIAVASYEDLGFTYYAYQLDPDKSPLFQDKAVRQALFIALDRQAIIDSILGGPGEAARGIHPPASPAYVPDEFEPYDYDPDRARALLAEAGWVDADGDGVVEKEGQRFSFSLLSRSESNARTLIATYMQEAWAAIGVEVAVELLPFDSQIERIDARDFDMVLVGGGTGIDPAFGWMFATGADDNFFGYSNAEFDQLEVQQRSTRDRAQRVDLIIEQSKIVWEELPVGILFFGSLSVGYTERLHNIFPNTFGGLMWSAPFWYLEV